jgi:putative sigma-54 modulation protein
VEITWQARNLELTDALRKAIDGKLQRLANKFPAFTHVEVELTREHTRSRLQQVVTEITFSGEGWLRRRAEERAPDALAGVDLALKTLKTRMKHLKGKLYQSELPRRRAVARKERDRAVPAAPVATQDEDLPEGVVRVKRFVMKPMSAPEAIAQMERLGHSFFLFIDSATGDKPVVYKRRDGRYSLIAAERE